MTMKVKQYFAEEEMEAAEVAGSGEVGKPENPSPAKSSKTYSMKEISNRIEELCCLEK